MAVLVSLLLTVLVFALELIPAAKAPLILIVNATDCELDKAILDVTQKYTKSYVVKTHNITKSGIEMIIELRSKNGQELVKEISKIETVNMVSLLSHDGEVTY